MMEKMTEPKNRLMDLAALQEYASVGRNTAMKIGKEAGALRKIGKKNLYDRQLIDQYIDSLGA